MKILCRVISKHQILKKESSLSLRNYLTTTVFGVESILASRHPGSPGENVFIDVIL